MADGGCSRSPESELVSCLLDGRVLPTALLNLAALVPRDAASLSLAVLNEEGNLLASSSNFLCAGDLHVSLLPIKGSVEGSCVLSRKPIMLNGVQSPKGGPLVSVPLFGEASEGQGERPVVGCLTVQLRAGTAVSPRAAIEFLLLAKRLSPAVASCRPEFLRQLAPVLDFESEIGAAAAGGNAQDGDSSEEDGDGGPEGGDTEDELGGDDGAPSPSSPCPPGAAGGSAGSAHMGAGAWQSGSCSGERRDRQDGSGGTGAGTLLVQEPSKGGGAEGSEGRDTSRPPRDQQGHHNQHQGRGRGRGRAQARGRQNSAALWGEGPGVDKAAEEKDGRGGSGLRWQLGRQAAGSSGDSSRHAGVSSQDSNSFSEGERSSHSASCCPEDSTMGLALGALPKLPGRVGKLKQLLGKGPRLPPMSPLLMFTDPELERGFRAWSASKMARMDVAALLTLLLSVVMVTLGTPTLAREQLSMVAALGIGPAALLLLMATHRRSYLLWRTVALSGICLSLAGCWLLLMRGQALEEGLLLGQPLGAQLDGCVWLPLSALAFRLPFRQRLPLQMACYALALALLPAACETLHPTCTRGSCLVCSAAKLTAGGLVFPLAVLYWAEHGGRSQYAARLAAAG